MHEICNFTELDNQNLKTNWGFPILKVLASPGGNSYVPNYFLARSSLFTLQLRGTIWHKSAHISFFVELNFCFNLMFIIDSKCFIFVALTRNMFGQILVKLIIGL